MIALSLAIAYLGTLAYLGALRWLARDSSWRILAESLSARVEFLEKADKSDAALRDTVSSLALQAGMKPPRL